MKRRAIRKWLWRVSGACLLLSIVMFSALPYFAAWMTGEALKERNFPEFVITSKSYVLGTTSGCRSDAIIEVRAFIINDDATTSNVNACFGSFLKGPELKLLEDDNISNPKPLILQLRAAADSFGGFCL